jgi:hypothetical protein
MEITLIGTGEKCFLLLTWSKHINFFKVTKVRTLCIVWKQFIIVFTHSGYPIRYERVRMRKRRGRRRRRRRMRRRRGERGGEEGGGGGEGGGEELSVCSRRGNR